MQINWKSKIDNFVFQKLWALDLNSVGRFRAFLIKLLRLLYVAVKKFFEEQLALRAMSLVYTTLLSFVPLLAVSFSVLKAFGVHNLIEPLLRKFLIPFGPTRAGEITRQITEFVGNMKLGVLGSIGLGLLVYTVISLIQKIEDAFNYIWKIKKPRSLVRKFSDYMSVISIGPLLIFSAIGLTASIVRTTVVQRLISIGPFGLAIYFTSRFIPYLVVCIAFSFIYMFMPNTKVQFSSALVGGLIAGVLWESTGWGFASFVVSSRRYAAIYSGFAIIVLFMIWLYLSWLIVLVGAELSFYYQYPQFLSVRKQRLISSHRLREGLVFLIMFLMGDSYYHGQSAWTLNALVDRLGLPVFFIQDILNILEKNRFIIEISNDPLAYLPARDMETITLRQLLDSVRGIVDDFRSFPVPEVEQVIQQMDEAIGGVLGTLTIKSLVLAREKKPPP